MARSPLLPLGPADTVRPIRRVQIGGCLGVAPCGETSRPLSRCNCSYRFPAISRWGVSLTTFWVREVADLYRVQAVVLGAPWAAPFETPGRDLR